MRNKTGRLFLFVDTETGGTIPTKHSLLQIGLVVWDCNSGIVDTKEFYIKSKQYTVTKKAQQINKFNLDEHNQKAELSKIVMRNMIHFLRQYFSCEESIPIIGHNVQFDINFLKEFFRRNNRSFNRMFSHRYIDMYSLYKTMALAGQMDDINSSAEAFKLFNIKIDERHKALDDCIATVRLFERLLDKIKYKY